MENEENQHPKPRKECKRHKGKRSYFYRTKNDERKRLKNLAGRKVLADLELNSTTGCSDSVPIAESAYYSGPHVTRIATAYHRILRKFPIHLLVYIIYASAYDRHRLARLKGVNFSQLIS